jgi:hypothetical protein
MPVQPPLDDDEPPAVPEEVWELFLTDSEPRIRATAPKEPSARARVVAQRLREQEEFAATATARRRGRWVKRLLFRLRCLLRRRPTAPVE